jgi:hypothetical protein
LRQSRVINETRVARSYVGNTTDSLLLRVAIIWIIFEERKHRRGIEVGHNGQEDLRINIVGSDLVHLHALLLCIGGV